jgi:acetyltransferase-like isoleucine patch superfamily enzyme
MPTVSLKALHPLRHLLVGIRRWSLRRIWRMDIHPTVEMSLSAHFDLTYPQGVHIGANSYIAFNARILAHDMTRNLRRHTRIGENCFIGGRSIILPGVEIGNNCIIGAGSVVTRSIPQGSIAAGNPARIIRSGVELLPYGRLPPE